MKLKNNNIKSKFTSRFSSSRICLWLTLLFSLVSTAQVELRESMESKADRIVIELGIIDHLTLFNAEEARVEIRGVNAEGAPRTEFKEKGQTLYISSAFTQQIESEPSNEDKLCSIEPQYPSFEVWIPKGKKIFVSIGKGNLYAEDLQADLELLVEEGLVRLREIKGSVKVEMNSGRFWFAGLDHRKVLAETSMGELVLRREDGREEDGLNSLEEEFGHPENHLEVRSIMGSIYLEQ